jgi:hypothetical protein
MKKCTGESGDIGDIAKNVKIAMQIFMSDTIRHNGHRKNDIALFALSAL